MTSKGYSLFIVQKMDRGLIEILDLGNRGIVLSISEKRRRYSAAGLQHS